jgi:hypothetical protein
MIIYNKIKKIMKLTYKKSKYNKLRNNMMEKLKCKFVSLKDKIDLKAHSQLREKVKLEEVKSLEKVNFKTRKNNSDLEIKIKTLY